MQTWIKRAPMAMAIAGVVTLAACDDDDPTGPEDHGDEVAGLVLELNGATLARYDAETQLWDVPVQVEVGEETAHIDVTFVAEDGDAVVLDDDFYLQVTVDDELVAEFEQDTPGEFGGHIHGVAEGTARMEFSLMHGSVGAGHADFVTAELVVSVVAAAL